MKSCWCQGKGLLCIIINQTTDIKQPLVVNLTSLHGPLCMFRFQCFGKGQLQTAHIGNEWSFLGKMTCKGLQLHRRKLGV